MYEFIPMNYESHELMGMSSKLVHCAFIVFIKYEAMVYEVIGI